MTDENIEDLEYFRAMAKDYGEKLDALYNIIKNSDWINIGTKAKHSIEKMFVILHNYKKELQITENKPITTKSQMINRIAELHEDIVLKTQECEDLKSLLRKTCRTLLGTIHDSDTTEQKLERIKEYFKNKNISQTSLFNINCIEQDILQIIDEVE